VADTYFKWALNCCSQFFQNFTKIRKPKFSETVTVSLQGMYTEHFTENKKENFFADFVSFLTTRRQESGMHF